VLGLRATRVVGRLRGWPAAAYAAILGCAIALAHRTGGAFAQNGTDPEDLMRLTALAASPGAIPGAAGAIPSILVVDDERPLREVLVRVLRRRGFETLEAPDAETALSLLSTAAGAIRVVITDERMPGMSGSELAGVIARVYPQIRVLLISGLSDPAAAAASPQVHVLPKPFSLDELLQTVTDMVG
jgi:CheY-like chemotaxis protein